LTSWFLDAAVAEPLAPPRRRTKPGTRPAQAKPKARPKPKRFPAPAKPQAKRRSRARSGIAWIAVSGALLAGVVFVNVAVLQLNLRLDKVTQERSKLRAETAALESQLSSQLASPRIQALARQQDGLVAADPSTIGYINLGR
jgi:cell division protein FtsL